MKWQLHVDPYCSDKDKVTILQCVQNGIITKKEARNMIFEEVPA